jgi:inner membrane transporter RhtA
MNLLYYQALRTVPLGITVSLEFTGPLAVAVLSSRRSLDFLWIALAGAGLYLLLPVGHAHATVDPRGAAFALGAGSCWALYIVFGQRAGTDFGPQTVALGSIIAAIIVVPVGVAAAGAKLFSAAALPYGLAIAFLSTALPYTLEMIALTRMPTRTFGILMSIEPAMGALIGWVMLREHLSAVQCAAIALIILASVGATRATSERASPVPLPE